MDSESNKNCLQCQHNITTFLRGDWWSSHLFIFSLISGFEAKNNNTIRSVYSQ